MKAINYILGFGAFAAVAAIFWGSFGLACGDLRVAAIGWLGTIWFVAAAIQLALEIARVMKYRAKRGRKAGEEVAA